MERWLWTENCSCWNPVDSIDCRHLCPLLGYFVAADECFPAFLDELKNNKSRIAYEASDAHSFIGIVLIYRPISSILLPYSWSY